MTAGPKALSHTDFGGLKGVNQADGTAATDSSTKGQLDAAYTNAISRANHTGTQVAATISDFDTQVNTHRLDQLAQPTAPVAMNNQRLTTLADPTSAQDAATRAYVDAALAGLTSGLTLKGTARVATTPTTGANINTASPGASIDGVALSTGDVVLLTNQTTASQNGPWVWNGAATPMTRPANFDTSGEAVLGSFWIIREGSSADTFGVMTNDTAVTLGTTSLTFVIRGNAAAGTTGYTTTNPTTSAGGSWVVTHNLNTRYVIAQVARTASPWDIVSVRIERTSVNTLTVLPDVALTAGDYEIMVQKVA